MPDAKSKQGNARIWGSDVIAEAIREQGFPYVCLTPGASYRGLHDSLVNYLGNERPRMLVALHEEHAIAMAQGYATVTDQPLAAVVHSNVGLMHAVMGIFDVWCARQPAVVFGATGPIDAVRRRPWIDWVHTTVDQASMIRSFTKWDDQPGSAAAAVESIRRASNIARTRPAGPVYINLDATIQETALEQWPVLHDAQNYKVPATPAPADRDLEQVAQWLNDARDIVMFAGRISRNEADWKLRIQLAEALGAKVIIGNTPAAFPTEHPLFFGESAAAIRPEVREAVQRADVILALEYVDIGGTLNQIFPAGSNRAAKIVNCTIDHHLHNGWLMDYHVLPIADLTIATTPESFTEALLPRLRKRPDAMKDRRSAYSLPEMPKHDGEIGIADLAAVLLNMTKDMEISLLGRPLGWPPNAISVRHPHDWLGELHGGGVGSGPGIAVGAALGLREIHSPRLPIMICGDGDFVMGCNAIWTAANEKIPLLIIVSNNRSYFNDELHQTTVAKARGRPVENAWVGQRIDDPAPDMATIARGFGLEGSGPIETLSALPAALRAAFAAVKAGKPYVLDVVTKREYVTSPITTGRKV